MNRVTFLRHHKEHNYVLQSTDHIRNVTYLTTHDLVKCACGFYGWVEMEKEK